MYEETSKYIYVKSKDIRWFKEKYFLCNYQIKKRIFCRKNHKI